MIDTITEHKFINYFRGSSQWRDHYSYMACLKIFELMEEDEANNNVEFCHYSITEEWEEHDTIEDYLKENDICKINDLVYYDIENKDIKDRNWITKKSVLINTYQSQ